MVPRSIFSSSVWKPLPRGANPSMAGMFSGATVLASYPFHVTRDSDIVLDEDDEDEGGAPFVILMHGDREVSQKKLARILGKKSVRPCTPAVAERHSGYKVGGISPFGQKRQVPTAIDERALTHDHVFVNGGQRGLQVKLAPKVALDVLAAKAAPLAADR